MKQVAFALIIILAILVVFMDEERQRLVDWYEDQTWIKQAAWGIVIALFISLCIAVILVPILWDWYLHLIQ